MSVLDDDGVFVGATAVGSVGGVSGADAEVEAAGSGIRFFSGCLISLDGASGDATGGCLEII